MKKGSSIKSHKRNPTAEEKRNATEFSRKLQEAKETLKEITDALMSAGFDEKTFDTGFEDVTYNVAWDIHHNARPEDWGPVPKRECKVMVLNGFDRYGQVYVDALRKIGLLGDDGSLTEKARRMYTRLHLWYTLDDPD